MNNKFSIIVETILIIIIISLLSVIVLPKLLKTIQNSEIETFTSEVQEIYRISKLQQSKINRETIYNNAVGASTQNLSCNKLNDLSISDKNILYTVTINYYGKITSLLVTNGKYEYIYNGDDLTLDQITEKEVKDIKFLSSEISLSLCE